MYEPTRAASMLALALISALAALPACAPEQAPSAVAEARQPSAALAKQTITLSTGITAHYLEAGDPSGEVVILLHGYTDTSRSWYPAMTRLSALRPDLHIFALDQRGHGGSSMPADPACRHTPEACFRPADFAADTLAFMDQKGIARASIAGHSMGSLVAQEIAFTHPDRLDRLVLVGTTNSGVDNPVLRDYLLAEPIEGSWKAALEAKGYTFPDDVYDLTPLDADPDAESWMAINWVVDPVADPAFIADIVPETARIKLGTWIGAARALVATDNTARLAQLSVPTLVIWATQDGIFPESPDQTSLLAALDAAADHCLTTYHWKQYGLAPLPPSGFQESDIGHNVQWGAPREVAADIARYLLTGGPTRDRYRADPGDLTTVITDPGRARILSGHARRCGP